MKNERLETRTHTLLAVVVWIFNSSLVHAQAEPELIVELDREQIYEGESVRYSVFLNHAPDSVSPRLDGFADFSVKSLGMSSINTRQVHRVNGRVKEIVRVGPVFQYELTPKRSGKLRIPAPTAEVDGKKLRGDSLELEVIQPTEQDLVKIEITSDRPHVYPMQRFEVRLTVAVRELDPPFEDRNPVSVLRQLPSLSIAWANDEKLPSGLRGTEPWQEWLTRYRSESGGFSVNNIGSRSVFSFFDDGVMGFMPRGKRVTRSNSTGESLKYWQYDFVRSFMPTAVGEFSFGPISVKGAFVRQVDRRGNAQTEDIFAVGKPVVVEVRDAPMEGRPDSYIHAIGDFAVDVSLAPSQAKVGDPLTVTLSLSGEGTLETARPPNLQDNPAVKDSFRVYEATEDSIDSGRRFTFSLRPLKAGEIEFPTIPVTYFDVNKEQYVTLTTTPITVSISESERIGASEIAMAATSLRQEASLESHQDGILANDDDYAALRNESPRPGFWLAYISLLGTVYLGIVLTSRHLARYWSDSASVRRRGAARVARDRLKQALLKIEQVGWRGGAEGVRGAFCGLVADYANQAEAGMTPRDATSNLRKLGVPEPLLQRLQQVLDACDDARYGGTSNVMPPKDTLDRLLEDLIAAVKQSKQ